MRGSSWSADFESRELPLYILNSIKKCLIAIAKEAEMRGTDATSADTDTVAASPTDIDVQEPISDSDLDQNHRRSAEETGTEVQETTNREVILHPLSSRRSPTSHHLAFWQNIRTKLTALL